MTYPSFRGSSERPSRPRRKRARAPASRRAWLERLEDRSLLAGVPFGAMPDDTGEYMLGDVLVNVVLMESTPSMSPFDANTENWTPALISAVKSQIEQGLNWWTQALDAMQNVRDGLLTYTIDWTYANNPVRTGYEPISRPSTDFSLWVQDFLATAGFTQGSDFLANIRAFNNAQRIAHQKHWAFTIFVVNNAAELAAGDDGRFAPGGFSRSFAYAGGNAFVMPADRPASTVAHETGHMFWALDEYNRTAGSYSLRRGYYDTQNTNANPAPDYVPQDSIMASGNSVEAAYAALTSSTASLEMIGWKDSDSNGIFDVLDVNFSLVGSGRYDASTESFRFVGTSAVRTLENKNPSGLQNDITINEIRQAQYKFDDGNWQTAANYQAYEVELDVEFPVPGNVSTITLRTIDTRTGVTSDEYVYTLSGPPGQFTPGPGGGGYVMDDPDSDGWQDPGEGGLGDWQVGLIDPDGNAVDLQITTNPDSFAEGLALSVFNTGVILTAVGGEISSATIRALTSTSAPSAGKVFGVSSALEGGYVDTFTSSRQLRAEFQSPVTSVSIRAYGAASGSVARMEAYNQQGQLLQRVTTGVIGQNASEKLTINHPNIAYVIVKGHANTKVVLDELQWGAVSSTTTDALGAWTLPTLPEGAYRVAVTPKRFYGQTGPATGYHEIVVDADGVRGIDFFFHRFPNPWRNDLNPLDVNLDGLVTARDALAVINWLNASGGAGGELPPEPEPTDYLLDVSDDGRASPIDALLVINELNRRASQLLGTDTSSTSTGTTSTSGSGSTLGTSSFEAEGEALSLALLSGPELAAKYYATSPLHVSEIPGVDPNSGGCTCGQCEAIESLAQSRVGASATSSSAEPEADFQPVGRQKTSVHLDDALLDSLSGGSNSDQ